MARRNSANRRARYQFGTDTGRLARSLFHPPVKRRHPNSKEAQMWEKMSEDERREYVLKKYGPGKKHTDFIGLRVRVQNTENLNELLFPNKKELKISFIPDGRMRYRFSYINRIIIGNNSSWIHLDFDKNNVQLTFKKINKNQWEYNICLTYSGFQRMNKDPFDGWGYRVVNQGKSVDGKQIIDFCLKERLSVKQSQTSQRKNAGRLVVCTSEYEYKLISSNAIYQFSGSFPTEEEIPIETISSCYFLVGEKYYQADVFKNRVTVFINRHSLDFQITVCNFRREDNAIFDERKYIGSTKTDKGHILKLYKQ